MATDYKEGSLDAPTRHVLPWRDEAWYDEAALDAYLEAPMKAVPGTRMAFAGVIDAADRKALILYLEAQK